MKHSIKLNPTYQKMFDEFIDKVNELEYVSILKTGVLSKDMSVKYSDVVSNRLSIYVCYPEINEGRESGFTFSFSDYFSDPTGGKRMSMHYQTNAGSDFPVRCLKSDRSENGQMIVTSDPLGEKILMAETSKCFNSCIDDRHNPAHFCAYDVDKFAGNYDEAVNFVESNAKLLKSYHLLMIDNEALSVDELDPKTCFTKSNQLSKIEQRFGAENLLSRYRSIENANYQIDVVDTQKRLDKLYEKFKEMDQDIANGKYDGLDESRNPKHVKLSDYLVNNVSKEESRELLTALNDVATQQHIRVFGDKYEQLISKLSPQVRGNKDTNDFLKQEIADLSYVNIRRELRKETRDKHSASDVRTEPMLSGSVGKLAKQEIIELGLCNMRHNLRNEVLTVRHTNAIQNDLPTANVTYKRIAGDISLDAIRASVPVLYKMYRCSDGCYGGPRDGFNKPSDLPCVMFSYDEDKKAWQTKLHDGKTYTSDEFVNAPKDSEAGKIVSKYPMIEMQKGYRDPLRSYLDTMRNKGASNVDVLAVEMAMFTEYQKSRDEVFKETIEQCKDTYAELSRDRISKPYFNAVDSVMGTPDVTNGYRIGDIVNRVIHDNKEDLKKKDQYIADYYHMYHDEACFTKSLPSKQALNYRKMDVAMHADAADSQLFAAKKDACGKELQIYREEQDKAYIKDLEEPSAQSKKDKICSTYKLDDFSNMIYTYCISEVDDFKKVSDDVNRMYAGDENTVGLYRPKNAAEMKSIRQVLKSHFIEMDDDVNTSEMKMDVFDIKALQTTKDAKFSKVITDMIYELEPFDGKRQAMINSVVKEFEHTSYREDTYDHHPYEDVATEVTQLSAVRDMEMATKAKSDIRNRNTKIENRFNKALQEYEKSDETVASVVHSTPGE